MECIDFSWKLPTPSRLELWQGLCTGPTSGRAGRQRPLPRPPRASALPEARRQLEKPAERRGITQRSAFRSGIGSTSNNKQQPSEQREGLAMRLAWGRDAWIKNSKVVIRLEVLAEGRGRPHATVGLSAVRSLSPTAASDRGGACFRYVGCGGGRVITERMQGKG